MSKIFQTSSDNYGSAVFNTTPEDFLEAIREMGYEGELTKSFTQTDTGEWYDFYEDNEGEQVLIEVSEATIEDQLVTEI